MEDFGIESESPQLREKFTFSVMICSNRSNHLYLFYRSVFLSVVLQDGLSNNTMIIDLIGAQKSADRKQTCSAQRSFQSFLKGQFGRFDGGLQFGEAAGVRKVCQQSKEVKVF